MTAVEYERHGLPWFDYYDGDQTALEGAAKLAGVKSVKQTGEAKGEHPLPENAPVDPDMIRNLGPPRKSNQVREGRF